LDTRVAGLPNPGWQLVSN